VRTIESIRFDNRFDSRAGFGAAGKKEVEEGKRENQVEKQTREIDGQRADGVVSLRNIQNKPTSFQSYCEFRCQNERKSDRKNDR
jgi:hypothetical protein